MPDAVGPRPALRRTSALVACICVFVAASCGAGSTSGSETEDANSSPVEELIGMPLLDQDAMEVWFQDREVERHELIAECMLSNGFEYSHQVPAARAVTTDLSRSSREYAEEFGFGIAAGLMASSYDSSKDYSTKNSRYVDSLSDAEADAYYLALHGETDASGRTSTSLPESGCDGEASQQVFEAITVFELARPEVESFVAEMMADSRMIALTDEWTRCMAEVGYPQQNPLDVQTAFYDGINEMLWRGNVMEFSPSDLPPEVHDPTPPIFSGPGGGYGVLPPFTAAAQEEIDALFVEEVGTAVANFDCSADIEADMEVISLEYEEKLVPAMEEAIAG